MISGSNPTRASSRPRAARPSTAATATTGATGLATTTQTGAGITCSTESDVKRNPYYASPDPSRCSSPTPGSIPISRTLARFNDPEAANHVTSANSPTPYRDDLFGPHFATSLFVSEPVHNLVHRMVLEPDGASYRGVRGPDEADREFLASSDNWFRPTQLKTGPDGALWVADMYRAVIEHPEWIPAGCAEEDRPPRRQPGRTHLPGLSRRSQAAAHPRLDQLDTAGLVAALDSPSGWQRDTAQRLLMHKNDRSAIEPLRKLAGARDGRKRDSKSIWTLSLLNGLDEATAVSALADPHPQVRRNAVKASEGMLKDSPRLAEAVLALAADPDPRVRLQVALALGNWNDPRAGKALAQIVQREPDDPWIRGRCLSSAVPHVADHARGAAQGPSGTAAPGGDRAARRRGGVDRRPGRTRVDDSRDQYAGRAGGIVRSLAVRGGEGTVRGLAPIETTDRGFAEAEVAQVARCRAAPGQDDSATIPQRVGAVNLLGFMAASKSDDRDLLVGLLKPRVAIEVQQAAISALARSADPRVPELLLRGWKTYSPQVRSEVLDAVQSRKAWTASLLSALEEAYVPPAEIDPRIALCCSPSAIRACDVGPRRSSPTRQSRVKKSSTVISRRLV